jgi:hypothetical protein
MYKTAIIQRNSNLATWLNHASQLQLETEPILNIQTIRGNQIVLFSNVYHERLNNCKRQEAYNALEFTSNFNQIL